MKIEIKNRWSGRVIFGYDVENNTIGLAVKAAIEASANLSDANLSDANLSDANLSDTNLSDANLSDANLSGANLSGADLRGADLSDTNLSGADLRGADLSDTNLSDANLSDTNLSGANLSDANLSGANLSDANLSDTNLSDANLSGANLSGANLSDTNLSDTNLSDANLSDANLTPIRDDIWAVISSAPSEVSALIDALKNGRVNGSTYSGDCSCLVGTIAIARGCSPLAIDSLQPNSSRPAERFFLGINKGDTPETNQFSALAVQWCQEWLDRMEAAFGKREKQ